MNREDETQEAAVPGKGPVVGLGTATHEAWVSRWDSKEKPRTPAERESGEARTGGQASLSTCLYTDPR